MGTTNTPIPPPPPPPPPDHRGPLSDREILLQISYWYAEIRDNLGATRNAIEVLEHSRTTYDERILELFQRLTKVETILTDLKQTVHENTTDLNRLSQRVDKQTNDMGKRLGDDIARINNFVHTTRTFGVVAMAVIAPVLAGIIIAFIIGVYHVVERLITLVK